MPQVPSYSDPQEQERPLPGARVESIASPGLLDAGAEKTMAAGQALEGVGSAGNAILWHMQQRENADAIYAKEADDKAAWINYQSDVQQNRQGTYAKNVTVDTATWWKDRISKNVDSLTNTEQQRLYAKRANAFQLQTLGTMSNFEVQQKEIGAEQGWKANKANTTQAGAADPTPDSIQGSIDQIKQLNSEWAARKGWKPEVLEAENKADITNLHDLVVHQYAKNDPVKATDYYNEHIEEINPSKHFEIERMLKTMTDAQYSRTDAAAAYGTATAQLQNMNPLPVKVDGATGIQPFDQKRIDQVTKFVKSPSPYDDAIQAAARAYNVNPNEIKLKIAIESGGDPKAVSSAGAVGLGQFMPATATQYGITDRTDPQQSIVGIAKMLAANGGTNGSNMAAADKAYIGKGPDADQYVENTRAARQAVMGPPGQAPLTLAQLEGREAAVIDNAKQQAALRRPGDLHYQDQVVIEARRNWAQDVQALRGRDYANYTSVLGAVGIGQAGAKSISDLPPEAQQTMSQLSPKNYDSIQRLMRANQAEGVIATPQSDRKYMAIMGQAVTDPVAFKARDIAADIQDLPKANQAEIMHAYISIDKTAAQGVNYTKALTELKPMLEIAKIRIPNAGEKGNYEDYNVFAQKMKVALDGFMGDKKRQPTQKEVEGLAAPLLANFEVKGTYFGSNTVRGFKLTPEKEARVIAQVPPEEQGQITSAFQKRYGRPPQPAETQQLYLLNKLHPGDRQAAQAFDAAVRQNSSKLVPGPSAQATGAPGG